MGKKWLLIPIAVLVSPEVMEAVALDKNYSVYSATASSTKLTVA